MEACCQKKVGWGQDNDPRFVDNEGPAQKLAGAFVFGLCCNDKKRGNRSSPLLLQACVLCVCTVQSTGRDEH